VLQAFRGDVFMANLEPVEGSEQGGTRPVVVVSRGALDQFIPVVVVCSITQLIRGNSIQATSEYPQACGRSHLGLDSRVRAGPSHQQTRLRRQLGKFDRNAMRSIDAALKITFDLP
jgi:mRNA interferase MazF